MKSPVNSKVSLVYARALFNAAKEDSVIDDISADLIKVREALVLDNEALYKIISSPIVEINEKKDLISKIFAKKINDFLMGSLMCIQKWWMKCPACHEVK